MDLLTQLTRAVEYIERNISDNLKLEKVSSVTDYSSYHFGRLFYYVADMPLSEYIRKRKLSLAAMDLRIGDEKVIDLALKYGYDNPDSFTRAFSKQHGITPTAARQDGVNFKFFPPLTFQIKIKGVKEMNWRIEEREAFEVFGIERIFGNDESALVPGFWTELHENGEYERLYQAAGAKKRCTDGMHCISAVCGYNEVPGDSFPYMICALKKSDSNTNRFKMIQIPKVTWAVFRSEKVDFLGSAMKELFDRAYQEWLPSSGYEWAAAPDLEVYYTTEDGKHFEECWIPVIKK